MIDNDRFWQYIFRIVDYGRESGSGEDLVEQCLEGREKTADNLSKIWKIASHFSADFRDRIRSAVEQSIDASGKPILSRAALKALEPPPPELPESTKQLLKELEESDHWQSK